MLKTFIAFAAHTGRSLGSVPTVHSAGVGERYDIGRATGYGVGSASSGPIDTSGSFFLDDFFGRDFWLDDMFGI